MKHDCDTSATRGRHAFPYTYQSLVFVKHADSELVPQIEGDVREDLGPVGLDRTPETPEGRQPNGRRADRELVEIPFHRRVGLFAQLRIERTRGTEQDLAVRAIVRQGGLNGETRNRRVQDK